MKKMNRINKAGQLFYLSEVMDSHGKSTGQTEIRTGGNTILVHAPIDAISQGWFYWTMHGMLIQTALSFLSSDAREFIMTGLTPSAWDELFNELEDEDDEKEGTND